MTWFKVDDGFAAHRKVEALQAMPPATYTAAITIWTLMGADCGLNLSDGVFSRVRARKITGLPDKLLDAGLAALVKVGLFDREGDECAFHEWGAVQPTRAQVEAMRAVKSAAGRSGGFASGESRAKQVLPKKEAGASSGEAGASTGAKQNPSSHPPDGEARARVRNPDPSRPEEENTHTAGATRCGTVELFGITGDEVLVALRVGAKGRINLAHDSRTLAELGDLVRDLSARSDSAVAGIEPYQRLAAWIAAGGLAWYDHGAPTLGYLLRPGVLATHLAEAETWHAAGRPPIASRKGTAARLAPARPAPAGPLPAAPRAAFEHATLAQKLGLRWRAPTDGSDRDAAFSAQTGLTVDEARRRVDALRNAQPPAAPAAAGAR